MTSRPRAAIVQGRRLCSSATPFGRVSKPGVCADDPHPERGAQPSGLGANAADADDERCRFSRMDDTGVQGRGRPFMVDLGAVKYWWNPRANASTKAMIVRGDVLVENARKLVTTTGCAISSGE